MPPAPSDRLGNEPDCISECQTEHGYWARYQHSHDEPQVTLEAAIMVAGEYAAREARKSGKTFVVASTKLPAPAVYVFAHDHPDAGKHDMNVMFEFSPSGKRIRRAPPARY
jgi:hypothetical protein